MDHSLYNSFSYKSNYFMRLSTLPLVRANDEDEGLTFRALALRSDEVLYLL